MSYRSVPNMDPGMVQKYVGTSYDILKKIYDNLEFLEKDVGRQDFMMDQLFYRYVATGNQTAFNGVDTTGRLMAVPGSSPIVYINRIRQAAENYTLSGDGTSVTFNLGVAADAIVQISSFAFNEDGSMYHSGVLSNTELEQFEIDINALYDATVILEATATTKANEASADRSEVAANLILTDADTVATATDVTSTNADVVTTNADAASTAQDAIDTAANLVASNQDTLDTAADLVLTNADAAKTAQDVLDTSADVSSTNADVVITNQDALDTAADVVFTNADVVTTNQDALDTAADRVATNQDTLDTAADLLLTDADTIATAEDRAAVAADLLLTGADATATAADRSAVADDLILTDADTIATAADRVVTTQDAIDTAADVVTTNADAATTTQDAIDTAADAAATAQDVIDTAANLAATNQDTIDTAADLAATNQDTLDTAADLVATAQDVIDTAASKDAAASSASAASTSESNAATSETNAAASFTNFNDRYLGGKVGDPTVDNDGDPLIEGTLYFNETDKAMFVYEGAEWVAAYASLSGAALSANNGSDFPNKATVRTNIGLGTAATTSATDYATAAQGSTADSALQSVDIGSNVQAFDAILDATTASYTTAEETKLAGVETSADVTDTINVTTAGALMDSEIANLAQVKEFDATDYATAAQGTTADSAIQSSEVGSTVQAFDTVLEATTASYTTEEKAKLSGVEVSADVTDEGNVAAAGALMASNDLSEVSSAEYARDNLGLRWLVKSEAYTAVAGEKIAADVSAGAWALTLPLTPILGAVVMVSVIDGDAATNNLTIDGNGNNIQGDTTLIYDVPLATVWLVYNNTEWRLA
jgi:hypothetical protein